MQQADYFLPAHQNHMKTQVQFQNTTAGDCNWKNTQFKLN